MSRTIDVGQVGIRCAPYGAFLYHWTSSQPKSSAGGRIISDRKSDKMGKTAVASKRRARPVPFRARPEQAGARAAARIRAQTRTGRTLEKNPDGTPAGAYKGARGEAPTESGRAVVGRPRGFGLEGRGGQLPAGPFFLQRDAGEPALREPPDARARAARRKTKPRRKNRPGLGRSPPVFFLGGR